MGDGRWEMGDGRWEMGGSEWWLNLCRLVGIGDREFYLNLEYQL
jgi:hypothetical protein